MSLFRRAAARISEARAADGRLPWGSSAPPPPSLVGASAAGIPVTGSLASGIAAVYGCCALLADVISALPLELRNSKTRRGSRLLPSSPLLDQPYAEMSLRDWWVGFIWALALRGNFYGRVIERDRTGRPVQVKPIDNDFASVWRDRATGALRYRFYGEEVPLRDVVHARYQTTSGSAVGLNPIQVCALTFGNAIASERFRESFFLNGADPRGVIEVPGYLGRAETRKMMRAWLAAHQSFNNANLPAILTEGATFKPITISPGDAQLLEAMGFSESQICGRIFRIPPHMVGIVERSTSWGKGLEQQERGFTSNTLVGYLEICKQTMTALHGPGQFVHVDTSSRERGTMLERAQAGALAMNAGIAVADDVREWFDWAPLPESHGSHSFMPINSQLLEAALLALQQAKDPAPPTLSPDTPPEPPVAEPPQHGGPPAKRPIQAPGAPSARPPATTGGSNRPPVSVPNGNRPSGQRRGNGHMGEDEAWFIVRQAVAQAKRMEYAADLATRIRDEED